MSDDVRLPRIRALLPRDVPLPRSGSVVTILNAAPKEVLTPPVARILREWATNMLARDEWTKEVRFELAVLDAIAALLTNAHAAFEELAKEGLGTADERLGVIALHREDYDRARSHFLRAIERAPADASSWRHWARVYALQGNETEHARALERVIAFVPFDTSAAREWLSFLSESGKIEEAREWLWKNRERYPAEFRGWWAIQFLILEERYTDALVSIGRELVSTTSREAFAFELECYERLNVIKHETHRIRAAQEAFPTDPFFNHLLATHVLSSATQAREAYERSLLASPIPAIAAQLVEHTPRGRGASSLAQLVARANRGVRREILVLLRNALLQTGRADEALGLLEKLTDADDAIVLKLLVETEAHAGCHAAATQHARTLEKRFPDDPDSLWIVAGALQRSDPNEAISTYQKLYKLTGNADALTAIGWCHHTQGRRDEAALHYRKSLQARPADALAVTELFSIGGSPQELVAPCLATLASPPRGEIASFAVNCVKIALAVQATLAPTWELWALERIRHMSACNCLPPF